MSATTKHQRTPGDTRKLFWFEATIQASQLESAMNLPGWSHCGPEHDKQVLWYPWISQFRKIYFKAKNRREACKQLNRVGLVVRDLSEGKK